MLLTVQLIGDSWVASHRLDPGLLAAAPTLAVHSLGFPGYTSGAIRRALRRHPDALAAADCIVFVVGVNDVHAHRGAAFYARHALALCRIALNAGVRPFLLAIPQYDWRQVRTRWASRVWHSTCHLLLDSADPIEEYRRALVTRLDAEHLTPYVAVIQPPPFAPSDFRPDHLHLTPCASTRLGAVIGRAILRSLPAWSRSPEPVAPPAPSTAASA